MIERRDSSKVRELAAALRTVTLGKRAELLPAIAEMRELLEMAALGTYSVRNRTGRWVLERWEFEGPVAAARPLAEAMFAATPEMPFYYHPLSPPAGHRNRVVDIYELVGRADPDSWDAVPMVNEVMRPLRYHRCHQPRVLMAKGSTPLGWFGAFDAKPATRRQLRLLAALAVPLRDRLHVDHHLNAELTAAAALDAMLEYVGVPAFVVDARGTIREANASGCIALGEDADLRAMIRRATVGGAHVAALDIVPIRADATQGWVVIVRAQSVDSRIAHCVRVCVKRWGLTARQAQVLELLVRGSANATIATVLGCVERTVELHVTAIFDRAGIDSRAALVARVLTADS